MTLRPKTQAEIDRNKKIAEQWDKPLSPPVAVPKSIPKKRGRPPKEEI